MTGLDTPRRSRRPSLTPMIDVVFLLLVFFMLASRFGLDQVLPLPLAGAGGTYDGPPRLIDVSPDGVRLNGRALDETALAATLAELVKTPDDMLILRGQDQATLQRIVTVTDALRAAGFKSIVLVE
ncbi:biopolymer transporter ExbD [Rhodobacteraceae bacterium F11138]|nr:biopolymer transporter ExbD [Rhodobacteraceae bacterium F11138]